MQISKNFLNLAIMDPATLPHGTLSSQHISLQFMCCGRRDMGSKVLYPNHDTHSWPLQFHLATRTGYMSKGLSYKSSSMYLRRSEELSCVSTESYPTSISFVPVTLIPGRGTGFYRYQMRFCSIAWTLLYEFKGRLQGRKKLGSGKKDPFKDHFSRKEVEEAGESIVEDSKWMNYENKAGETLQQVGYLSYTQANPDWVPGTPYGPPSLSWSSEL